METKVYKIYSPGSGDRALAQSQMTQMAQSVENALTSFTNKDNSLDAAVQKNAADIVSTNFVKGNLWAGSSLDNLTGQGVWFNRSYDTTGLPAPYIGTVYQTGDTYKMQMYQTWSNAPQLFIRHWTGSAWKDWQPVSWKMPDVSTAVDLNTIITPGQYGIFVNSAPNKPVDPGFGLLEVLSIGPGRLQRYTTWEEKPRTFERYGQNNGATWGPWRKTLKEGDVLVPATSGTSGGSSAPTAGNKIVPLTMTAPGGIVTEGTTAGSVRWVRKYAHAPRRVRVHIQNADPGRGSSGGALTLGNIYVGAGDAQGNVTSSALAQGAGATIPGFGSELVTPWTEVPGLEDGGHFALSVSWTGGDGTTTLYKNQGGGWQSADPAQVNAADTSGWTFTKTTPFHCWIEAEVPARAPVILGHGDSITVGTTADSPVEDSYVAQLAYRIGAMPVVFSMHGSNMLQWKEGEVRWQQYGGYDMSKIVDIVVTTMGQNDLREQAITYDALLARHKDMMPALQARFPNSAIFYGSITPSVIDSAHEVIRRQFNDYRKTLPFNARGYLDFATPLGDATDENLKPELTADNLHPNTAGHAVMADVAETARIAPRTLTDKQTKTLLGG